MAQARTTNTAIEALRRPDAATDLLQIVKCTVAATVAWWLSVNVLESPLPFLAPWTALLTVHATVHRSLSRGLQTTVASAIGVGLSFVIGFYLGVNIWTFALAIFVGLAGARVSWLRDEGVAIATTAVFVLGSGFSEQQPLLPDRIIEVGIGVAIGVLVNALVIPPLRDQQAASHVAGINRHVGDLLVRMADEFATSWETDAAEGWLQEIESVAGQVDSAWSTVRFARESRRANPRRLHPRRRVGPGATNRSADYEATLLRLDEGVSHLRHLVRTLHESSYSHGAWDEQFRARWSSIVRDTGEAIADPQASPDPVRERIGSLTRAMADDSGLPRDSWPVYGSLLTVMSHISALIGEPEQAA